MKPLNATYDIVYDIVVYKNKHIMHFFFYTFEKRTQKPTLE